MVEEISAADELAALLALDALPEDEQADAELRYGTFPAQLADVVAVLAEGTAQQPPDDLRSRTLERALERRPDGRPVGAVESVSAAEAFDRTVAEFAELLGDLSAHEWQAPAHSAHGDVRGLVAHLVGVERLCLAWLDPSAPAPVDPHLDHVAATRPTVDELAGATPEAVAAAWHDAARAVAAQGASGDPNRPVSFHDVSTSVDGLLVMRTFELWAHAMDIALATGRAMPTLDAARMTLMSTLLIQVLPGAMAYRGGPAPRGTARLVLTGDAGGCYTVALEPGATVTDDEPVDVTIVTDVVDLCRVAARRLPPEELAVQIEGDRDLAHAVLARV
ncbi:MAG TPA: maleylpyruvate isomerase family mycothiol-dependent enzyme, partial [Jatrophihabitans sp.]|nr:maleylpyruvate isomerase family mycothiol-dependent enzyme [Jatrophihabitans sp.]